MLQRGPYLEMVPLCTNGISFYINGSMYILPGISINISM